jgi:prepilin-type N-terminal cleavage/methylation domain-containing protein
MNACLQRLRSSSGYSLIEVLANVAILGTLALAALPHLDTRRTDLQTVTKQVIADYRWARVRSITSGVHFAFKWNGSNTYQIERMKQVPSGQWVTDEVVKQVALPSGITHSGSPNFIEFNTRGLMISSAAAVWQTVSDTRYSAAQQLVIWPSGQAHVYE